MMRGPEQNQLTLVFAYLSSQSPSLPDQRLLKDKTSQVLRSSFVELGNLTLERENA